MTTRSKCRSVEKPKLGKEIGIRLKRAEGQLKAAADKFGFDYKSLRQDLYLSRFFEADVRKLCSAAGLPTDIDELGATYEFSLRTEPRGLRKLQRHNESAEAGSPEVSQSKMAIPAVFSFYELRQEQIARISKGAREDIASLLFNGLGAGDSLFLTITDELPLHWRGQGSTLSLPLVARGIEEGLHICYLHPSEQLHGSLAHVRGARFLPPQEVQVEFASFRRLLENFVETDRVERQTVCVDFDAPVLCVPQHRFALYHHLPNSGNVQPMCWATVTVPLVVGVKNKEKQTRATILEVSDAFRDFLHDFCRSAVDESHRAAVMTSGPEPCIKELKQRLFWRASTEQKLKD